MSLLNKFGIGPGNAPSRDVARPVAAAAGSGDRSRPKGGPPAPSAGAARVSPSSETTRVSNGLKELLWNLDGLGRGTLLDLGPAWQTTLSFFIERGFRVTADDVLRSWSEFQVKEAQGKEGLTAEDFAERTPEMIARKFLAENLKYAPLSFDALLLWDLL